VTKRILEILFRALYAHMNIFTPEKCRKYAQACRVLIPLVKDASAKADLENTAKGWERMAEQHAAEIVGVNARISTASVHRATHVETLTMRSAPTISGECQKKDPAVQWDETAGPVR